MERSSMAKDTRWDRNLSVAPDADGLIGHAGGGAAAQAGGSVRPDLGARRGAGPEGEVPADRARDGAGLEGGGDRAGSGQHEWYRRAGAPGTGPGVRAGRYHGAADAGAGRSPGPST